jgi:hypothetical protein
MAAEATRRQLGPCPPRPEKEEQAPAYSAPGAATREHRPRPGHAPATSAPAMTARKR